MGAMEVGACFAVILVIFVLLLFKDSNILKGFKKFSVKKGVKNFNKETASFVKKHKPGLTKLARPPLIYYRKEGEKVYKKVEVSMVPFTIGTSEGCDLKIADAAASEKHMTLNIVKEDDKYFYCLKNHGHSFNTEYLDQEIEEIAWMKLDKNEEMLLTREREAFYLGNTKLIIEPAALVRKVSASDNMLKSKECEEEITFSRTTKKADTRVAKKRIPSDRVFQDKVLDVEDISF